MNQTIENFWIRCYLGSTKNKDFIELAINRAYRDLNRTIHGMKNVNADHSKKNYRLLVQTLEKSVLILLNSEFDNQDEFDRIHEKECNILIEKFSELYGDIRGLKLYIGQAQKWINMSLKYLYAIGKERHQLNLNNYIFFHIPIDNIIQEKLKDKGIFPLKIFWSRLDSYIDYLNYQKELRRVFHDRIPMDVEFEYFNS